MDQKVERWKKRSARQGRVCFADDSSWRAMWVPSGAGEKEEGGTEGAKCSTEATTSRQFREHAAIRICTQLRRRRRRRMCDTLHEVCDTLHEWIKLTVTHKRRMVENLSIVSTTTTQPTPKCQCFHFWTLSLDKISPLPLLVLLVLTVALWHGVYACNDVHIIIQK